MEQEKVIIELKNNKMVTLVIQEFDTDIDLDNILRIDYSNILGEILTFGVLYNRVGNLRAEAEAVEREYKMDTEIFESQLREEHRKKLQAGTEKRVTDTEVETAVKLDSRFAAKKRQHIAAQKNLAYMESFYWAAQAKSGLLSKLSEKLRPEEFEKEILEEAINGVLIKISTPVISN